MRTPLTISRAASAISKVQQNECLKCAAYTIILLIQIILNCYRQHGYWGISKMSDSFIENNTLAYKFVNTRLVENYPDGRFQEPY